MVAALASWLCQRGSRAKGPALHGRKISTELIADLQEFSRKDCDRSVQIRMMPGTKDGDAVGELKVLMMQRAMALFVGLDVSLGATSICVVEADGSPVWEGKAESEPAHLIKALPGGETR